jgi:RNA polymerase sigma factor (sigma-70 family)
MNALLSPLSLFDPERLADERGRLVRYCTRVTGSADTAEDLAQETLATAWRNRALLRDPDAWQAWLTGIARNLCLRWLRAHSREQAHRAAPPTYTFDGAGALIETVPDAALPDMDQELEREEISLLLDRAMALLPERAREVLVDRYVHDLPVAEIAARRGVREETANVHLHRGRQALRRALTQPGLREDAVALGLVTDDQASWQVTNIWCPHCGTHRLEGRFGNCPESRGVLQFTLWCRACAPIRDALTNMFFKPESSHGNLLEGVKGFKPALNRIIRWWDDYAQTTLKQGHIPCMRCARPLPLHLRVPENVGIDYLQSLRGEAGVLTLCEPCKSFRFAGIEDLSLHHEAVLEFWQRYPRMRMLHRMETAPSTGLIAITRFESVLSSAAIEIVHSVNTMKNVGVYRNDNATTPLLTRP